MRINTNDTIIALSRIVCYYFCNDMQANGGDEMNRKEVDNIVRRLLEEQGEELSRKEIARRFEGEYSWDQRDRIYYRYRYMLRNGK